MGYSRGARSLHLGPGARGRQSQEVDPSGPALEGTGSANQHGRVQVAGQVLYGDGASFQARGRELRGPRPTSLHAMQQPGLQSPDASLAPRRLPPCVPESEPAMVGGAGGPGPQSPLHLFPRAMLQANGKHCSTPVSPKQLFLIVGHRSGGRGNASTLHTGMGRHPCCMLASPSGARDKCSTPAAATVSGPMPPGTHQCCRRPAISMWAMCARRGTALSMESRRRQSLFSMMGPAAAS